MTSGASQLWAQGVRPDVNVCLLPFPTNLQSYPFIRLSSVQVSPSPSPLPMHNLTVQSGGIFFPGLHPKQLCLVIYSLFCSTAATFVIAKAVCSQLSRSWFVRPVSDHQWLVSAAMASAFSCACFPGLCYIPHLSHSSKQEAVEFTEKVLITNC